MFCKRDLSKTIKRFQKFPIIAILGPRQSGKTTFVKEYFDDYRYVNLEDLEWRSFAKEDPNRLHSL